MRKSKVTADELLKEAQQLLSQRIDMPEAKSGKLSIEHEIIGPGQKKKSVPVVTIREAIFRGYPVCDLRPEKDTVIHWLKEEDQGSWMSDMPCELIQMEHDLNHYARRRVLIGGLGLGILANMVARKPLVTKIVVVEQSEDVIKLVQPYLPQGKIEVVHADIFEYLKTVKQRQFNVALLDTWQGTGEWTWVTEVVPMRRILGQKIPTVKCWLEEVMWGQVWNMLTRAADTNAEIFRSRGCCHYYAFRKGLIKLGLRTEEARVDPKRDGHLPAMKSSLEVMQDNANDPMIQSAANAFFHNVGKPGWERLFGQYWDEAAWNSERKEKKEDIA